MDRDGALFFCDWIEHLLLMTNIPAPQESRLMFLADWLISPSLRSSV